MNVSLLTLFAVASAVYLSGCERKVDSSDKTKSSEPAKKDDDDEAKPEKGSKAEKPATPEEAKPKAAKEPQHPQRELCGKYLIGAPADAKLEEGCFVSAADYRLSVKPGKADTVKTLKGMFEKDKAFKGFVVDESNGFVTETKDKGGVAYVVLFGADLGGKSVTCESTLAKSPKTVEKAKEAYAVCKSLTAK